MIVQSLRLKSGRTPESSGQTLEIEPVTIFVGPNNSGKSKVLAEIHRCCFSNGVHQNFILDGLDLKPVENSANAEEELLSLRRTRKGQQALAAGSSWIRSGGGFASIRDTDFIEALQSKDDSKGLFRLWVAQRTLMLNGTNRIAMTVQQDAGDFQEQLGGSFQKIFLDDARRAEFRDIVFKCLGIFIVIDPTFPGKLRLRISSRAPVDGSEERGWNDAAIKFHGQAEDIDAASDGVRAFVGMILELMAGDLRVLLIDEPEAFLHPALAFKLGIEIGKLASSEKKNVFLSTHSAPFLMGCLQSGTPMNIVRLTYEKKAATSRVLPNSELVEMMRQPLLRSTNLINGLFYDSVIVTEGDTDRAFYSEINERLNRFREESGIPNCLFLNAQNKQTLSTMIKPLRELGIPTACIVDVDILTDGAAVWTKLLDSASVPEISRNSLTTHRSSIKAAVEKTGKVLKRDGGLNILSGSDRQGAENLLETLSQYGIFVIPGGELECWLKDLEAGSHGPNWLISIFSKMRADPSDPEYLKPSSGDVWAFLLRIKEWLVDVKRRGIPS